MIGGQKLYAEKNFKKQGFGKMKIIRFLSDKNQILTGVYDAERPGWAKVLAGDIADSWRITSQEAQIRQFLAPLVPVNILALGINYQKHGDETDMNSPDLPVMFLKATSSVIGHEDSIVLPACGPENVDYEAELAVIIGKKMKNIQPEDVLDYVFGYTCANDVSARDWQIFKQKGQWARGKSFDTFCPLGPWIVTADELENPNDLAIRAVLNGQTVQEARTSEMIFNIQEALSDLSRSLTLPPKTVVLTGTPQGVGFTRKPPLYLRVGDVISVEIDKIGVLTNRVLAES